MNGEKIKKIRELKGRTQEYMAEHLEMSQQNYSNIERNEVELKLPILEKITKILGVSINDVLNFDEKMVFNVTNNQNGTNSGLVINHNHIANPDVKTSDKKTIEERIEQIEQQILLLISKFDKL